MRSKMKIWIVLVLLVVASLACSLGGAPEAGEEVAGQPATAEAGAAPGGEQPTGEAPALEIASDALSGLNSYRAHIVSQWTPLGGEPESTTMEEAYTREPAARRIVIETDQGTSEMVQIGDTSWLCSNGTCAQTQMSEDDLVSGFGALTLDPGALVSDADHTYVGEETVNNVQTRHYSLSLTAAEVALLSQGSISDVYADVWIADEAGLPEFVVRHQMGWKETRAEQEGTFDYSYEVYDVNAPITIEPPAGATAAGLPEDVPLYPGATELFTMEELTTFSAADDVATVTDFYRAELVAQGWTNTSDESFGGVVSQTWTKEDRTLNLMITSKEESGTSVMITLE
jgi:outer membrane lipoprotein-sorting protein